MAVFLLRTKLIVHPFRMRQPWQANDSSRPLFRNESDSGLTSSLARKAKYFPG